MNTNPNVSKCSINRDIHVDETLHMKLGAISLAFKVICIFQTKWFEPSRSNENECSPPSGFEQKNTRKKRPFLRKKTTISAKKKSTFLHYIFS